MGKSKVIPRIRILAEVTAALSELVLSYERDPKETWQSSEDVAAERLALSVRPNEAQALIGIARAERIECANKSCRRVVPTDQAAGDLCTWCAAAARAETR